MATAYAVKVTDVRFEHYRPGYTLGRDEVRPRLSWKLNGLSSSARQDAYEIEVHEILPSSRKRLLGSYQLQSGDSILVPWPCDQDLLPRQRVSVRVRVNINSKLTPWSAEAIYETGLGDRSDWVCQRITSSTLIDKTVDPSREHIFRKTFSTLPGNTVCRARLYVAAQGVYEAHINGRRVSNDFLAPGWTKYDSRIRYQTYDVTELLDQVCQAQTLTFSLAQGWFCGRLGFFGGRRNIYGPYPAIMAQLELSYGDDPTLKQCICTNESWVTMPGPSLKAELYDGEKYDANLELPLNAHHSIDEAPWQKVCVLEPLPGDTVLIAGWSEPVRRVETVQAKQVLRTPLGKQVVDFGQNLVGYTRIMNVKAPKGTKITLSHAEVLEDNEISTRPLRQCYPIDEYTCGGNPQGESWEPRFTFHGFRYCQVDGLPEEADLLSSIEAVVCHTDMEPGGDFICSNPLLNQLHSNARWSMRGNFLSIPTDCPQRDERLGWTGDIAQFAPTATKLYNCANMLRDWMVDVALDQAARNGVPPFVSPNILCDAGVWSEIFPVAIWADVVILVPWALYEAAGDAMILEERFGAMEKWIMSIPRGNGAGKDALWDPTSFQLGDWLDPTASPHQPMDGQTDPQLVANAFLIQSLDKMARISSILGKKEAGTQFAADSSNAREQFANEYISANGRLVCDSQTAYALAISFNLFPKQFQAQYAGDRLSYLVRRNNFKVGTGFAGTPLLCKALAMTGHTNVAYAMLLCEECPSWLYTVRMGATTLWERWDSMLPDGSINPGEMTSFNHYCFGSVLSFLYEVVAGLQCVEPGYKAMRAAPVPDGGLTSASASHETPFGLASCAWELIDSEMTIFVEVPPFTTMEVVFPPSCDDHGRTEHVGSGKWSFSRRYVPGEGDWPVEAIRAFPSVMPDDIKQG